MRKFVVVNKNRAERVVCCEDPVSIEMREDDALVEVPVTRKVYKGETFHVSVPVKKSLPYLKIIGAIGALAAAGGLAFYFWG